MWLIYAYMRLFDAQLKRKAGKGIEHAKNKDRLL